MDVLDPAGGRKILVADTFVGFPAADKNDGVDTDGWAYQNFHVGGCPTPSWPLSSATACLTTRS